MKHPKREGWTAIPNELLENIGLSSDGMRLVCWLISHKGDFKVNRKTIAAKLGFGEHRLRKAIKEAKSNGYLKTIDKRCKSTGRLSSHYEVSTDGRYSTGGKPTSISTLNESRAIAEIEATFCGVYPAAPTNPDLFRQRLLNAVAKRGLENVLVEAERYEVEVATRTKGGRIARPENWLWRLLYGHLYEVIETDVA